MKVLSIGLFLHVGMIASIFNICERIPVTHKDDLPIHMTPTYLLYLEYVNTTIANNIIIKLLNLTLM